MLKFSEEKLQEDLQKLMKKAKKCAFCRYTSYPLSSSSRCSSTTSCSCRCLLLSSARHLLSSLAGPPPSAPC
jgi:hypothetical protein